MKEKQRLCMEERTHKGVYIREKKSTHEGKITLGESYTQTSTDAGVYTWKSVHMEKCIYGRVYT